MDKNENQFQKFNTAQTEIQRLKQKLSQITIARDQALMERDRYLKELTETRNSKTYKLAHALTAVPRKLRGYRYKYGELPDYQKLYPYMISVVIAVYNTADFLPEMLGSILAQKQDILSKYLRTDPDAQFQKHVFEAVFEIILVDDGSDDGSEDICDSYARKYSCIKVLHKENGGVSSARNAGIAVAQGKYITFPDSDDKLSANVMEECFRFFEEHESEISMVTYPLHFFDARDGEHWTSYRFENGTRILDMLQEWDKPQYFTAASFFKTEYIKENVLFDENVPNGEDIKFVHNVLYHDTARIGLVSDCTYWYRRRSTGERSAIQQSKNTENYYIPYLTGVLEWLFAEAEKAYGEIPAYVQYTVMGQLQWRLRSDGDGRIAKAVIGEEKFAEYRRRIKDLIRKMDHGVLMAQRQLFREHLFYVGNIRTDFHPQKKYDGENIRYYFEDFFCADAAGCYLRIEFMTIENNLLCLEGFSANLEPDCENWILIGGKRQPVEICSGKNRNVRILDETAFYVDAFQAEIPLAVTGREDIYFGSTISGMDIVKTRVVPGKFMPVSGELSKSYYSEENWTVRLEGNRLSVWNMSSLSQIPDFEQEFEGQILESELGEHQEIVEALAIRKQALYRRAWRGNSKQIWLISDRYSHADDNGEVLFEFLMERKDLQAEVYFVLSEDSPDFERLSAIGNVVAQDSKEYMILYLTADCIISSQADEYIIDPVWRKGFANKVYKDFYCRRKYVFLQHGVIKDDLSRWLNRYNKGIDGFICSAFREARSIREYDYYYDDRQIWLTGLPRYDRLYHNEKRNILVMPTWRKWLMEDYNAAGSDKDAVQVKKDFAESGFYWFYNALLNHSALLEACETYGYTLCFLPHSNLRGSMDAFDRNHNVLFLDYEKKYRDAFAEADLLLTDYSSTAMDFAYLRKPVIYAQFDKDRFFAGEHTYQKGYFEYEKDGFGEVVYDLESLVRETISYMQSGCSLKPVYRERIESFFAYNDHDNCQRVFDKITELMVEG